jgi:CheY-like chemotaxis protein/KaiC/GvpD/RAD55 family RecA-like ATPase
MSKILIVDDDQPIRTLVQMTLAKEGHEVVEAEDGEQGFKVAQDEHPDLIIADIIMPVRDGYQLAQDLRSHPATASVPIIMLTALQQEQDELRAFQEGVDDYITKPFSPALLRARVAAVLTRSMIMQGKAAPEAPAPQPPTAERVSLGNAALDGLLDGGLTQGSNVLVIGELGSGKSYFCRRFLATGLENWERCMAITLDDEPLMVRRSLDGLLPKSLSAYEGEGLFRLVDAYSWSRGTIKGAEPFAVSGMLELNQLAGVIADAGLELGQTVAAKAGGRRFIDTITSLFINFELASVQRFLAQLARTATSYGGVTSLFVLEEGAVTEQVLNNIKYIMDGVLEFKIEGGQFLAHVVNMKWSKFSRDWATLEG